MYNARLIWWTAGAVVDTEELFRPTLGEDTIVPELNTAENREKA
jgi:hypothetical protein